MILKNITLALVGTVVAAGAFYWYLQEGHVETNKAIKSLLQENANTSEEGAFNLKEKFQNLVSEDTAKRWLSGAMEKLSESPKVELWVTELLIQKGEEARGVSLQPEERAELSGVLMELRHIQITAMKNEARGEAPYTPESEQRFQKLMVEGESLFKDRLGVTMSEFLGSMGKEDFNKLFSEPE